MPCPLGRALEFRSCAGQVRPAYLDPPFNTQQSFADYDDALSTRWLTMMRDRLLQIRRLLSETDQCGCGDDSEQREFAPSWTRYSVCLSWRRSSGKDYQNQPTQQVATTSMYNVRQPNVEGICNLLPPTDEQVNRYTQTRIRGVLKAVPVHAKAKGDGRQFYDALPSGRGVNRLRSMLDVYPSRSEMVRDDVSGSVG